MEDQEFADFWQLLGYHDAITPEIQRVALAAEVFWPCEIYYHAPADVRDGLIHALLSAEYSSAASNLMSCLAMQGDDKAMETLLELERNPRPWRKGLYVDPSSYAQIGGWTFDKEGQKIQLNFDTCYPMVKGTTDEKSPVREKIAGELRMGMDTRPVSLLPTHHDGLPPRFGRASEIGTTVAVGGIVIEPVQRMVSEPRHDILLYPFAQPVVYRTGMRNLQQSGEKGGVSVVFERRDGQIPG